MAVKKETKKEDAKDKPIAKGEDPARTPWSKLTKAQKQDYIDRVNAWYRAIYGNDYKVSADDALILRAYKNGWNDKALADWVRTNETKWLKSEPALAKGRLLKDALTSFLGDSYDFSKNKELTAILERWMKSDPNASLDKYVSLLFMKTDTFKSLPDSKYYEAWAKKNGKADQFDAGNWGAFQKAMAEKRDAFTQTWKAQYGATSEVPQKYIDMALEKGWDPGGVEWGTLLKTAPEYAGTDAAKMSDQIFVQNWQSLMGDVAPPAGLMEKWRNAPQGVDWDTFFALNIKDSAEFKAKYPDYAQWENNQHAKGYLEGTQQASISEYIQTRNDFVADYKETFGPTAVPPTDLLNKAVNESWSVAQWHSYTIKNDPKKTETAEYQSKSQEFVDYWQQVMGPQATIPQNLLDQYATSNLSSPSLMWNEIKSSREFQNVFPNWSAFEQGATAAGINTIDNPMLYNKYKEELNNAFTNIGMTVPVGFERDFFATGLTVDVGSNLETWDQTKTSYGWQSGQSADLATAAGVGSNEQKAAGGDLRKRMKAALDQHRAYAGSQYKQFRTDETKTGDITRKI